MPTFKGLPQSILTKITTSDSQLALWTWATTSMQTDETIDQLVASGFERVPINDEHYLYLASQGCDIRLLNHISDELELRELRKDPGKFIQVPKSSELELWALPEDIQQVKRHPVILAFPIDTINFGIWYQEKQPIQMLQSLPPPQIGEFGAVLSQNDMHIHIYPLSNLPSEVQQLQSHLHHSLETLASPSNWYPWTPFVSVTTGDHFIEGIGLYSWLLNQPGSTFDKDKFVTEHMAEAKEQIQQIQAAQANSDWLTQWQEIQRMMKDLAAAYWKYHLGACKSQKEQSLPEISNVFQDGISSILTSLPFQAYPYATIASKDDWHEEVSGQEHEVIIAYQRTKKSGATIVQLRGDATGRSREMVLTGLFEQVKKLSDLDSDIFWAMTAQLLKGQKDAGGNTWITASQILDYRGIAPIIKIENGRPRRAGHRQEDIEEISQRINSMENTWIRVYEQEVIDTNPDTSKGKKRGRNRITRESRLFMFGDIIHHQELSMDGIPGKTYPIAWQFRESTWMLPFLEGPNRFIGVLLQKTLNYDPHNEFWEKRLAKYFMVYLRANAANHMKQSITIQTLFDECNLPINRRFPQRTRDRFEKAMNTLQKDGHLVWKYKENEQPSARNWLTTWLSYHVMVEGPEHIKEQYQHIETHALVMRSQERTQHKSSGKKRGKKT